MIRIHDSALDWIAIGLLIFQLPFSAFLAPTAAFRFLLDTRTCSQFVFT